MTSFLKPITSKRLPAWSLIPIALTLLLLFSSGFVGITDDEAYYWVLAQRPALGYAYHPPMVAWFIALSQSLFGWAFGMASTWVVRIPSCLSIGAVFALALSWIYRDGRASSEKSRPSLVLASFAGLMALGWMMVPDVPLFLGWMLCFYASWILATTPEAEKVLKRVYATLALGVFVSMLGKISAIMIVFSAIASIFSTQAGRSRLGRVSAFVALGFIIAMIPICAWNAEHGWSAILYQLRERHEDFAISWKRYLRFWIIELFAAGPVLVIYTFFILCRGLSKKASELERFVALWILPAAGVYCLQPLMSDFKPHWAFVVWWPGALALAWRVGREKVRFSSAQIAYGLSLGAMVLVSLNFPILSLAMNHFRHDQYDPKLDVTNDLYGWNNLSRLIAGLPEGDRTLVVVGSRYQTASQAAFNLPHSKVTMLPRDLKSRDEWPTFPVADGVGPEWPHLVQPILFVTDNRYDAAPEFPGARCAKVRMFDEKRMGMVAKQIWIWKCQP